MKRWQVDPQTVDDHHPAIVEAAANLKAGSNIAFPTETVYGLGADASHHAAVEHIFIAKGRPSDNPLIVHIADIAQLDGVVDTSDHIVQRLMARFWPGALTLVLPLISPAISPVVTAGLDTLAVRMPDHPVALCLIRAANRLIAAPSANRSGRPSPTKAEHVVDDLDGRIAGVIDGGATGIGVESTVVRVSDGEVHILRSGAISHAELQGALPGVVVHEMARVAGAEVSLKAPLSAAHAPSDAAASAVDEPSDAAASAVAEPSDAPRSPGMKYKHYAPQGKMILVKGESRQQVSDWIQEQSLAAKRRGERTGILTYDDHTHLYEADVVLSCGRWDSPAEVAQRLYDTLRAFDQQGVSTIWAEACLDVGIGQTVLSRLEQASSYNVVNL